MFFINSGHQCGFAGLTGTDNGDDIGGAQIFEDFLFEASLNVCHTLTAHELILGLLKPNVNSLQYQIPVYIDIKTW